MVSRKVYQFGLILTLIFLLNFAWEISQMALYAVHTKGIMDIISVHLRATLGDMILFLIIYTFGILVFRNRYWAAGNNKTKYTFVILAGSVVSILVEKLALLSGRWSYNQPMPTIPVLNVGLTPVLQMIILPIIAVIFSEKISRKY
ncbi:MAG: hypothetical protein A2283_09870 [Lentisphaerae bacterium RIFOXYA12_FULL_48_11]|nr:MAG: hypothetical protein A2259_01835 [Candidatus Moranbacteria bacterium RIFOXYA2_FULL_43_15]OGV69206.1 MAG: hypothetical protein A2283_09870 [Lentisphaerae bacterium RIFOXYA12_FULL_48_11]